MLVLLAAIVPVAAVVTLGIGVPFILAVAAGYVLQLLIVGAMVTRWSVHPRDPWIAIAVIYALTQLITLGLGILKFGGYESQDLLNVISKSLGVLMFAGVIQALVPTEQEIGRFLGGYLGITVASIVANVALNGADFPLLFGSGSTYALDFGSFFANRNQFGSFLFLSLVAHLLYLHGRKARWWNVGLFAAQFASILLTLSRGSMLATVVLLAAFAVLHVRHNPRYFLSLVGMVALLVTAAATTSLGDFISNAVLRADSGLTGRDDLWVLGLEIWRESGALFGVGLFQGIELARAQGMAFSEFHSFGVETLLSGGVVEAAILAVILGIVWRRLATSPVAAYPRHVLYASGLGMTALSLVESISLFTIGLVGTMFSIFAVSLPLLYSRVGPGGDLL